MASLPTGLGSNTGSEASLGKGNDPAGCSGGLGGSNGSGGDGVRMLPRKYLCSPVRQHLNFVNFK